MSLKLTKKVKYNANERLDLIDKSNEEVLNDATFAELIKGLITDSPHGRIFRGWRTTTVLGANVGFTIAAEPSFAVSDDGVFLERDGTTALTTPLATDAINYIHAYYDEADSDTDGRRFYIGGVEVTQSTLTRIARSSGIYNVTTSYGSPVFSAFQASANIGGVIRRLIPLYAVTVNSSDVVTNIYDYRPMFAPALGSATNNLYNVPGGVNPDLPHSFFPTNAATIGITDIRSALVAITDRLKQIKNTTTWYDDNFNEIKLNAVSLGIRKTSPGDVLNISGGDGYSGTDARIALYGRSASFASQIRYNASKHIFRGTDNREVAVLDPSGTELSLSAINAYSTAFELTLQKARGAYSAPTIVSLNDSLGQLQWQGHDGTSFSTGASIEALVDDTPGASNIPTRLVFSTRDASGWYERMRITSGGKLLYHTSQIDTDVYAQFSGFDYWHGGASIFRIAKTDVTDIKGSYLEVINQSYYPTPEDRGGGRIGLAHWCSDGSSSYPVNSLLGAVFFGGLWGVNATWNETRNVYSAAITAHTAEERSSAANVGTYLSFHTVPNASSGYGRALTDMATPGFERMRIGANGSITMYVPDDASDTLSVVGVLNATNLTTDEDVDALGSLISREFTASRPVFIGTGQQLVSGAAPVEQTLTTTVTMLFSGTSYDGPSTTLESGTWLVTASGSFSNAHGTAAVYEMYLNVASVDVSYKGSGPILTDSLSLNKILVLTGSTTVKLRAVCTGSNDGYFLGDDSEAGASIITAVQLAS
jgi:hypothetical protein